MKTIGLIGGMSWESTVTYYQLINEYVKKKLGGFHSAKIVLYSVDFDEIEKYQSAGDWAASAAALTEAAKSLEQAGADFILICTNTMHKVYDEVQAGVNVPLLHIAEATADALITDGIDRVLLQGTKYTMLQDFYKQRLIDRGIEVMLPADDEIETINDIIFGELCLGKIKPSSKEALIAITEKYAQEGALGVILGCTEIGLLIGQSDVSIPVYDTAVIHAEAAANEALK